MLLVLISGLWRKEPQSDLPMLSETKESNQGVSEDERRRIPGEVTGSDGAGHGSRNQGRKSWVGAEIKGAPANTHILPCLVQPWIVFHNNHRKNPRSRIIVNLNRWLLCWKYCCNPMAKAVIHGNKPEANISLDFRENVFQAQSWKEIESWVGCDESGPPGSEDGSEVNAEEKAYRWWQCSALTTLPGCASGINVGWSPSPPHHIVPSSTIISSPSYHLYNSSDPLTLWPNCKHWILIICIFFGNPAYHGIPQQYNTF